MNILDVIRRLIEAEDRAEAVPQDQEAYEFNYALALSDLGFPVLF